MPVYKCKVGNEQGSVFEREVAAESEDSLRRSLEAEGLLLYEIVPKGISFHSGSISLKRRKIKIADFLVFNQELTALLRAGLPIVSSLETLAEEEGNPHFARMLNDVAKRVKEGAPFSDAVEEASGPFTNLYVSSIRAGEKSGDIIDNIRRYISYVKKVEELKKKLVSAAVYPLILLTVATGVVFFLLLFVVPSFSQIFLDSGSELPMPTRILITITDIVKNNIIYIILFVIAAAVFFTVAGKNVKVSRIMDQTKISIPWIGDLFKRYSVAKFSRTLSTILKGGSPLVTSLSLAAGVLDNSFLEEKIITISQKVREGEPLAAAIKETGLMPATALKMVMVGESSGSLEDMFENIAELFEEEVDRKIGLITTTIEPFLMLFMGLIVALIVVAMYLPVFKLAGAAG